MKASPAAWPLLADFLGIIVGLCVWQHIKGQAVQPPYLLVEGGVIAVYCVSSDMFPLWQAPAIPDCLQAVKFHALTFKP